MQPKYLSLIAQQLSLSVQQINNVYQLDSESATIPFIARYRKEATGNLDEVVIANIIAAIKYYTELEKRKETIVKTIQGLNKLTPELQQRIEDCKEATLLEDIYLPYKPKRKTRAVQAIEKGLEPLAKLVYQQGPEDPQLSATPFLSDAVQSVAEALQGARDIVAEWICEDDRARNKIRQLFTETAVLTAKILTSKKEEPEAQKYKDYFQFTEPLRQCPSHRMLAIRRAEKEGFLIMDISISKLAALEALSSMFILSNNANSKEVAIALEDSIDRLLHPSIESECRLSSKTKADEEAIGVFAENVKQLLLSSPLGNKRVLALDPGFRTGCKLVCLDEQGNLLYHTAIYPHPPQNELEKSTTTVQLLVKKYAVAAIGIGNGTAGRETEQWIRRISFDTPIQIFQVNEAGASIYSASAVAREEFPDLDITVRGAISIGRRLLDPLSELVKIDPKSIGVGQYQHDVNPTKLKEELDRVVASAVNFVGVDVNTASAHLLVYVSGLGTTLAKNIVAYRAQYGPFKSREALKKVPLMGPKTFEQCAGFLRITEAANLLDNSSVHPESYAIVEKMATAVQASLEALIQQPALRKKIDKHQYISEQVGLFTIEDILKELEKPGRDPRAPIQAFEFDHSIKTIQDLQVGMKVPGLVTNITNFGAFVDIGVKQDGLVHISQLRDGFVSNPNEVVKLQQKVMVTITEIDVPRKRIALSMKTTTKEEASDFRPSHKEKPPSAKKSSSNTVVALTPFQTKLMELKKKME
jgi:protein Tex